MLYELTKGRFHLFLNKHSGLKRTEVFLEQINFGSVKMTYIIHIVCSNHSRNLLKIIYVLTCLCTKCNNIGQVNHINIYNMCIEMMIMIIKNPCIFNFTI